MKVLMVLLGLPVPETGSNTRNFHLLKALASTYDVSILALCDGRDARTSEKAAQITRFVDSLQFVAPPLRPSKRMSQIVSLARGESHSIATCTYPAVQAALDDAFSRGHYDIALFHTALPAGYRLPNGVTVVIDQHNIEYELLRRTAEQEPLGLRKLYNWLESRRLEPIELQRCAAADAVLVTSERERQALLRRLPGARIEVVPNGVDLDFFSRAAVPQAPPVVQALGAGEAPRIIFTGALNYFPNVDAVVAFAQTCWPRIREQAPDASWVIVGKNPLPRVQRLAELPGVSVIGSVPDVRPYLATATVAIAPLLVGGGTRLKILEACAMGLPVVATSLGCEGLAVVPGEHLLVADTPEDLAAATLRCLGDSRLRARLAASGRTLVEAEYGWERCGARLLQLLRSMEERAPEGAARQLAWRASSQFE